LRTQGAKESETSKMATRAGMDVDKSEEQLVNKYSIFLSKQNSFFKPDFIIGSTPICEFRDYCFWLLVIGHRVLMKCCQM
jgi:hypothetical protein